MKIGLFKDTQVPSKKLLAISIATSGTLAWFFLLDIQLIEILTGFTNSLFWSKIGEAIFFAAGAASAIIGGAISGKVNRRKLLWSWITLGVLSTVSLVIFQGLIFSILFCVLLGVSLGLGFPIGMAFLADYTKIEGRARVTALIMLETFAMVILGFVVGTVLNLGLTGIVLICAIIRATSYLALFLDPCDRKNEKACSWKSLLLDRNFGLFIFPWIMFNMASGLASFVVPGLVQSPDFTTAYNLAIPVRYAGGAIFGLIAGIWADRRGRKLPIVIALVMLGVSFAFIGLAASPLSVFIYRTLSGTAWGILMVIYLAVPGDLSRAGSNEKYYALGTAVPLIIYLGLTDLPMALNIFAPANIFSPILSIILFASIIPIIYASETLPESKIRARKMKEYIKKVGKVIQESKQP